MTPVLSNLTLGAAQVVISYSPPDGAYSTFVADHQSISADGQDSATLTFTAQDANGNPHRWAESRDLYAPRRHANR
ncbi:MAG: hypothetical protein G5701_02930 [Serratia symbiotica]|nr:hypothetical protein [Serratia symbiotica]